MYLCDHTHENHPSVLTCNTVGLGLFINVLRAGLATIKKAAATVRTNELLGLRHVPCGRGWCCTKRPPLRCSYFQVAPPTA